MEDQKINTNGKMKIIGYSCIGFAAVLTLLRMTKVFNDASADHLITYWGGLGFSLVIGNSAKHIIGNNVKKKGESLQKEQ